MRFRFADCECRDLADSKANGTSSTVGPIWEMNVDLFARLKAVEQTTYTTDHDL